MSNSVSLTQYLQLSGLAELATPAFTAAVAEQQQALQQYLQQAADTAVNWQYQVPELGEGGACSLFGVLAAEPYDLTAILGGQTAANQQALSKLSQITAFYQQQVKLSYFGAPSRAEFPLTAEFAAISNNSTVGLSGKARVINSVASYLQQGGEYYTCDPKVQAEACLPLYAQSGRILGIVDAEDFQPEVFNPQALALLVAVCLTIPDYLPAV
ncbi:MAG: histidine kinase [Alishewanella sp. 34-51-39]|nr:MAG: histidine kinase [Alishewanella sp. 34-51-39]